MKNLKIMDRILIILGTVLILLPVVAPIIFAFLSLVSDGIFRLDYLMPGELFFVVLVGGILLLVSAIRLKEYRALVGGTLGAAIFMLIASQVLAVVTGLAYGPDANRSWPMYLVMGGIILYDLLVVALGVEGIWMGRHPHPMNASGTSSPA